MKLRASEKGLMLIVDEEVDEGIFDDIITALSVRLSLRDNVSDPAILLNTTKKRITSCFLKEDAGMLSEIAGNQLIEDEWAIREMEKFGFFLE